MVRSDEIDITEAAQRLGFSWHRAWRAVLTGSLKGRREGRAWKVDAASVERLRQALLTIQPGYGPVHHLVRPLPTGVIGDESSES